MAKRLSQQEYNKRKAQFEKGYGWCSKCRQFKPLADFARCKSCEFGYYGWCKECHSAKRKGNEKVQKKARDRANLLNKYYADLMGGQCQKCGYSRSRFALDYHHVNPVDKEFVLSQRIPYKNHNEIMAELDKCILLCANCHREYESGIWAAEFIKREVVGWTINQVRLRRTSQTVEIVPIYPMGISTLS